MSLTRSATKRQTNVNNMPPQSAAPGRAKTTLDEVLQGIRILKQPPEGSKPDVDIVFVPGLGTDPVRSWESVNTKFNWVTDQKEGLARDFPKARLMLYQYESAWLGDLKVHQYMRNIANTMLIDLHDKRQGLDNLPIVFIGHSMGGLVIAKAITLADSSRDRFPTMSECIAGCLFFGTPFHGTPAASLASSYAVFGDLFDRSIPSKLLELMKPGDETLRELRTDFIRLTSKLTPKTELFYFYEEHPTNFAQQAGLPASLGGFIPKKVAEFVSRESATMHGISVNELGLASNHRDLVKFDGPKDSRYQLMRAPLKRIVHGSNLLVKNRVNATRNIDRETVLDVKRALEGPDGKYLRRKLDPRHELSLWLKDAQEYQQWLYEASDNSQRTDVMWIRGQVGRGKTTNTISVLNDLDKRIANLQESSSREPQPLVVYYFCDGAGDQATAEDILKSLLVQLIEQQEALAAYAKHFAKKKKGKDDSKESARPSLQPTIENLWQTIQDMMYDPFVNSTIYFVVNNLHFLSEESPSTSKLLAYIGDEVRNMQNPDSKKAPARWLISSRSSDQIKAALEQQHVRLVDLEDEKYEDEVQKELRKHAYTKVSVLREEKHYERDVAYFAHSLMGKRAQNVQWIDIAYLYLKALKGDDSRLKVRQTLDTMPQNIDALLDHYWQQLFRENASVVEKIKEILRALVLTFEDPTAPELTILAGMSPGAETREELRQLVEKCKPLLVTRRTTDSKDIKVGFTNIAVKMHLLENSKKLLGLSEDETKWQHGMLAFRSFAHITEKFAAVSVAEAGTEQNPDREVDVATGTEYPNEDAPAYANSVAGTVETAQNVGRADDANDYDDWSEDSAEYSDDEDDGFDQEDEEENEQSEDEAGRDAAMAYMVKYWLRHAGYATREIARDLTASGDTDFWMKDSLIRRLWLIEFARLDGRFEGFPLRSFSALHVAAAVGFPDLVDALIKDGHQGEIDDIDDFDNTPLHLAAHFDEVAIVDVLLKHGAKIDHGKEKGVQTPLHMASLQGYVKVMTKLIAQGADINAFAHDIGPVLNGAIVSGNAKAVELLLDANVGLSIANKEDENVDIAPPLAMAAMTSEQLFDVLISKCADKLPAHDYDQALIEAAGAGQAEVFDKLLTYDHPLTIYQRAIEVATEEDEWEIVKTTLDRQTGLDCHAIFITAATAVEDQTEILRTVWRHTKNALPINTINEALYRATDCENTNIVRVLLHEFGADANAEAPTAKKLENDDKGDEANEDGDEENEGSDEEDEDDGGYGNALTAAANDGIMEIIDMLLDKGAAIDHPAGWPLQAAAAQGHNDVVEKLLAKGADVNAMTTNDDFEEGSALQAACEYGHTEVVRTLLEHGADPNLGAGDWTCPLISATAGSEEEITRLLLEKKAAVNVHGGLDNGTPLIYAAAWLSVESVQMILQAGATVDLFDNDGDTALIAAAKRGDSECIKILLENGADITHSNNNGQNALQAALETNDSESIRLLVDAISGMLLSIKQAVASRDDATARIVRNASILSPTSRRPLGRGADFRGLDVETISENPQNSGEPGLEINESVPTLSDLPHDNPPWHPEASVDDMQRIPNTLPTITVDSNSQQQQQVLPIITGYDAEGEHQKKAIGPNAQVPWYPSPQQAPPEDNAPQASSQQRQSQDDYTIEPSVVVLKPEIKRKAVAASPPPPAHPINVERNESEPHSIASQNRQSRNYSGSSIDNSASRNQFPYQDPTTNVYARNNSYQYYNNLSPVTPPDIPGRSTPSYTQQLRSSVAPDMTDRQPFPYSQQVQPASQQLPPPPQPPQQQQYIYGSSSYETYETPIYQAYTTAEPAQRPPDSTQSYQPYKSEQNPHNGAHYGAPIQQQPSGPQTDTQRPSSGLFGVKDTYDRAKQFGMNRWRS